MKMSSLKDFFKSNEWDMISHILEKNKENTWLELANMFLIKSEGTSEQKRKAANDVWRKYNKISHSRRSLKNSKILVYDIETSKTPFELWWSGKQFVNGNSALDDSKIVTISYKWLGSDTVEAVIWDKKRCDKKLMQDFLKVYNQADMVIGINNDRFDNKFINTRAAKYGLDVNLQVKSLDVQKECRRLFRLPSYSMKYLGRYFEIPQQKMKVHLEDIWEDLVSGNKKQAKKAMKLLIKYNIQDILTTEQLYIRLKKYLKHPIHLGLLEDKGRTSCPTCGTHEVELYKTTYTATGTIQRIMQCKEDGHLFKISNSDYLKINKDE